MTIDRDSDAEGELQMLVRSQRRDDRQRVEPERIGNKRTVSLTQALDCSDEGAWLAETDEGFEQIEEVSDGSEMLAHHGLAVHVVDEVLDRLDKFHRDVFWLVYGERKSTRAAADQLGVGYKRVQRACDVVKERVKAALAAQSKSQARRIAEMDRR